MSTTTKQLVYVVMGNDYPGGVFSSKELAEDFMEAKKKQCAADKRYVRIYWRAYEYVLDDTGDKA